jgi:MFS family permease
MLDPQQNIAPRDLERGIKNLIIDAAAGTAIGALNSGVVLLALALHIGATNLAIGILAAIPLLTQMLQAPTVKLVERLRRRRQISVISLFLARLALPVYAAVPFMPDRDAAIATLIGAALVHYGLNAVAACSWNSWMRDLIPVERLGAFFARRGLFATAVSAAATIIAAVALESVRGSDTLGDRVFGALYILGFACGLVSTGALARVPEPQMEPAERAAPLRKLLWRPLTDPNFRSMLRYLASWQFAVNLATPFFTVYFVRELGYGMGFVLLLTVVSQLANIAVVRGWGRLSDRFTNKSVLTVATPLFLLCIGGMVLAGEFPSGPARAAYLIALHVAMGAAGAGVGLAAGNIVMKLSPEGGATSYMATNALVGALAAGVAPIVGGWVADYFARRRLELEIRWSSPHGVAELFGLDVSHWEFFFLLAALLGLYTLHRLSMVHEAGSVERREVVQHIFSSARRSVRNISSVAGLRVAVAFPGGELIKSRERRRFLLEPYFVGDRAGREPPTARAQAVGTLLGAAFKRPTEDREMEQLLGRLDRSTRPSGS